MHRLDGPRLKVERANKHIHELEAEIRGFFDQDPYYIIAEEDSDTGDQVFRVKVRQQPPLAWSTIIGDVVHNLRAALDLLVWQLVEANGQTPTDRTMFPVAYSKEDFEAGGLRRIQGASKEAIRLIRALKPYRGGNDALWRLHRLDITDKHRLLFTVGSVYQSVILGSQMNVPWQDEPVIFPDIAYRPVDRLFPLEDCAEVYRVGSTARESPHPYNDPKFTFNVAFGEGEIVKGEPIVPALHQLADFVDQLLATFVPLLPP